MNAQYHSSIASRIAEAAQRDNATMKGISILGMLFLPGTFVSVSLQSPQAFASDIFVLQAIFSMSFFHFTDQGENQQQWTVSREIWMYWVVTLPLTVITIGVWLVWSRSAVKRGPPKLAFAMTNL